MQAIKTDYFEALQRLAGPNHDQISVKRLLEEFHALDADDNLLLDEGEKMVWFGQEVHASLTLAFPPQEG